MIWLFGGCMEDMDFSSGVIASIGRGTLKEVPLSLCYDSAY
jgi:hypothetical protein